MINRRWLFVACYGTSGAAALVYQVVWMRLLTLVFGHTVASSSIVLGAFMCGLAFGAWAAGRLRLSPSRALGAYAALELLIGASALVLPFALSALDPLLGWAYADGTLPMRFLLVRATICFVLLAVPATAMGATFPVAVAWIVGRDAAKASGSPTGVTDPGVLYAANTTGAASGALAAGFWLVPSYGLQAATWFAIALNLVAAAGALWLRRAEEQKASDASFPAPRKKRHNLLPAPQPQIAIGAAALSGFAALAFEVAWTRLIATIIGPTTYAFALMAASFIVGIAVGSALGVALARSRAHRIIWLCATLIVTATASLAAAWFAAIEVPYIVARYVSEATAFGPLLLREALIVGFLVTMASIPFGATFTLALAAGSTDAGSTQRDTSTVYAANTVGAVLGSLLAGFVLLPQFGLASTFLHTSRLLVVTGAGIAAVAAFRRHLRRPAAVWTMVAAASILVATFGLPRWNEALLASGMYKYARQIGPDDLLTNVHAGRLEYYKEGNAGTVSVKVLGGTRSLAIDGKVDASNGADMLTQRLLGLLPALLHPHPRDALVIGLGTGVTSGAVLASGTVQRLDIVEISPEVVAAAQLFEGENGRVLGADGVRLLIGDGRTHLQLSTQQYDLIVSEPSNPWMAGVAALFTREFFEAARQRLTPDGVFCQWAHTYEIEAGDLRSIVRTFGSVFPNGTMWLVGDGDLLLIGRPGQGIEEQLTRLPERLQRGTVSELLDQSGVPRESAPFFLLSLYAGGAGELASYGGTAAIQSDDRMSLEFTAARAMYAPPEGNAPDLRALAEGARRPQSMTDELRNATAAEWVNRGKAAMQAEAAGMAHESFRRAVSLDRGHLEALRGAVTAAAQSGRLDEESRWLRERAGSDPQDAPVRIALSYALALTGDMGGALASAFEAHQLAPDDPDALEQLASVLADTGDERLSPIARTLVERFPDRPEGRFYQATALMLQNRDREADIGVRALLQVHPQHAKGWNLQGVICASRGNYPCAIAAFEASLKLDPRDAAVYVNLGNVYLERGDAETAARFFHDAMAIDPAAEMARTALRTIEGAP